MTKTVLLAGVAALALSGTAFAGASHPGAVAHGLAHQVIKGAEPGSVTLYDQTGNDSGIGIVSDNFDSGSFDNYDDQAADDFSVPAGHTWKIKEVDAIGVYFNGSGPQDGVNLFLYKNKHGLPSGAPLVECDNLTPTDNFGSFTIKVPKSCKLHAKGGTSGKTYWLSVQANMNFVGGRGEWGWENQTTSEGNPAAWQNPGGGFSSTGCTVWKQENQCIPDGQGDHMFALKGKDAT